MARPLTPRAPARSRGLGGNGRGAAAAPPSEPGAGTGRTTGSPPACAGREGPGDEVEGEGEPALEPGARLGGRSPAAKQAIHPRLRANGALAERDARPYSPAG